MVTPRHKCRRPAMVTPKSSPDRPLVWWWVDTPPMFPSFRRLRHFDLGAYGVRAPREWFPGPRCGCRLAWLKIERTLLLTTYVVIDDVSNGLKVYDLEWPKQYLRFFFAADFCEIKLLSGEARQCELPLKLSNETNNCLHTSVSIEIYSAIARFTCNSTYFFLSKSVLSRLKSFVFSSRVKSHFIQVVDLSRLGEVPSRSQVRLQWYGWLPGLIPAQ